MFRVEARGSADDTIDINRRIAFSADEMVVVIPHSGLIQGGTPRRLDAPQDARGDQSVEIVIDRLTRKRAQAGSSGGHDEFGVPMASLFLQNRQHRCPGGS